MVYYSYYLNTDLHIHIIVYSLTFIFSSFILILESYSITSFCFNKFRRFANNKRCLRSYSYSDIVMFVNWKAGCASFVVVVVIVV